MGWGGTGRNGEGREEERKGKRKVSVGKWPRLTKA
jgi:hypothetical protein